MVRIAIVTDIHHGPPSHTKSVEWNGLPTLRDFVDRAEHSGADIILDLGDRVSDISLHEDRRHAREVAAEFSRFGGPCLHLLGNHDVVNLTVADNESILAQSLGNRVLEFEEFRLIAWQPSVAFSEQDGFQSTADSIDWLVDTLLQDKRPAVVATHVPVSGQSQVGNYYFELRPHLATYPDHEIIRKRIEATGRVALWVSGHVHRNGAAQINGTWHLTVQSMSERSTTMPFEAMASADLIVEGDTFSMSVNGYDRFQVSADFAAPSSRTWLAPMSDNPP